MNYELALKLKNAGFPQKGEYKLFPNDGIHEEVVMPSLSELIEACEKSKPNMDFALFHWGNWVCGDRAEYEGDWITRAEGETPEIAVANLWLKLNNKSGRDE